MVRQIIHNRTPLLPKRKSKKSPGIIVRQPKIARTTLKLREHRPFPWRPIFRIILASIVVATVVWAFYSPIFQVRSVVVEGLKNVSQTDVLQSIPKQANIWLFPTASVRQKIRQSSPYVADVAIYRGIPSTIKIVVAERVLAADWESDGKHYILGLDGTVLAVGDSPTPMLHIIDTKNIQPLVGNRVATAGFMHFAGQLHDSFEPVIGGTLKRIEIGETTFDVTLVPDAGPKIIVDSTRSADVQLKAAKLVLDQFKDRIGEYVDMRVPGRAYFK